MPPDPQDQILPGHGGDRSGHLRRRGEQVLSHGGPIRALIGHRVDRGHLGAGTIVEVVQPGAEAGQDDLRVAGEREVEQVCCGRGRQQLGLRLECAHRIRLWSGSSRAQSAEGALGALFGLTGLFGETGDFADTGDFGLTGDLADTGDFGETGDLADTGDFGETGDFADTGDFGVTGDVAETGVFGLTGVCADWAVTAVRAEGAVFALKVGATVGVSDAGAVRVEVWVLDVWVGSGVLVSADAMPMPPRTVMPMAPVTAQVTVVRVIFMMFFLSLLT